MLARAAANKGMGDTCTKQSGGPLLADLSKGGLHRGSLLGFDFNAMRTLCGEHAAVSHLHQGTSLTLWQSQAGWPR